jgi:hypothetical protein
MNVLLQLSIMAVYFRLEHCCVGACDIPAVVVQEPTQRHNLMVLNYPIGTLWILVKQTQQDNGLPRHPRSKHTKFSGCSSCSPPLPHIPSLGSSGTNSSSAAMMVDNFINMVIGPISLFHISYIYYCSIGKKRKKFGINRCLQLQLLCRCMAPRTHRCLCLTTHRQL